MNNHRNGPKGEYSKEGPWQEIYVLTERWKLDLQFYKDDLRFLHHLIDKYLIWITKTENLDLVREIKVNLSETVKKCKDLLDKVGKHLIQVGYLVEKPNEKDAGIFKMEHEHLEDEMIDFVKSFRENRKEVFAITEYIMDSEKLINILES